MNLTPERYVKANINGIDNDITVIETDYDITLEFESVEKACNTIIILKEDFLRNR